MTLIIRASEMATTLYEIFKKYDFSESNARHLAKVHTTNTLHGVNSHGINRVPLFIDYVKKGIIKVCEEAKREAAFGSIERWDGDFGSGVINAMKCTNRAIE